MNAHQNAHLTPHSRYLICTRVLDEGQPPSEVATSLGVSLRTIHKWLARYRAEDHAGLTRSDSRVLFGYRQYPPGLSILRHI